MCERDKSADIEIIVRSGVDRYEPDVTISSDIPDDLAMETVHRAVEVIEDWETAGSRNPVELFLSLRVLVLQTGK
jgi:hypothetical protein